MFLKFSFPVLHISRVFLR